MRTTQNILPLLLIAMVGVSAERIFAQTGSPAAINPAVNPVLRAAMAMPQVDANEPVRMTAEFDPPVVSVGEKAFYRITLNALQNSVIWPSQLNVPDGLSLKPGARGQVLRNVGGEVHPLTAMNFQVVGSRPGIFFMPVFFVDVSGNPVISPEAVLKVVATNDAAHLPARQLHLKSSSTNAYLGDAITVYTCLASTGANTVEGLTQLQFTGGGFLESRGEFRQSIKTMEFAGRTAPTYVGESRMTPLSTGPQTISVAAFTSGGQFSGQIAISSGAVIAGGQPDYVLLESEPLTINVRPLPPEGVLPGFNGFIGDLVLDRPQLNTNALQVGDAIQLTVTFRSDSPLTRFVPPALSSTPDWEVFAPALVQTPASAVIPGKSQVTVAYTMIALSSDVSRTPVIPFSIFDREKGGYVDRSIPSVELKVTAQGLPGECRSVPATDRQDAPERSRSLSRAADHPGKTVSSLVPLQMRPWFFGFQLAPALGFLALWLWDRRRLFLEAHPEIVRARQARKALWREKRALAHAATAGDARAFNAHAVAALQIAAAPHFPATPRAMVCGEILSLFEAEEREGRPGQVIRELFERDGAVNFAGNDGSQASSLTLRPDLEQILEKMEARL